MDFWEDGLGWFLPRAVDRQVARPAQMLNNDLQIGQRLHQLLELSRFPNTYLKLHGMGEICPAPFPYTDIPPFVEMAYQSFGPQRMMWGSDFPPVSLREGYRNALRFTMQQMTYASAADKEWIFGRTALGVYRFPKG